MLAEFPFLSSVSCNCSQSIFGNRSQSTPPLPKPVIPGDRSVIIKSGSRQGSPHSVRAVTPREQHLPRERSLLQKDLPDGERQDVWHPCVPYRVSPSAQIRSCTQETPGSPRFANLLPERLWIGEKKKKKATTGQCSLSHSESLRPKIGDCCFKNIIQITLGSICLG